MYLRKKQEISLTATQQKKYDQIWNERMHITNEKGSYFATLNMLREIYATILEEVVQKLKKHMK